MSTLPTDSKARKDIPLVRGLLDYFPGALAAVAEVSRVANEQHNPGAEMHWAREKSKDHADCLVRHLVDRGAKDADGLRHSAKIAWRALALLQEELEAAGALPGRASRFSSPPPVGRIEGHEFTKADPRKVMFGIPNQWTGVNEDHSRVLFGVRTRHYWDSWCPLVPKCEEER